MSIFEDLANTKLGDVKPPVLIPIGHYTAMFSGQWKEHKAKSGNVAARFPFKLAGPGDDVDAEAIAALEGGLPDKEYTLDFWMSPDSLYRYSNFAKAMGISEDLGLTASLSELASCGEPFTIEVTHQSDDKDSTKQYLRFDNPAPVA